MKLKTSTKTSTYGKTAHIKKGYYPAKLMKVEEYKDKEGNMKVGKYGRQLIFEFAIFKSDPESGEPIAPMTHELEGTPKVEADVVIPKFVYHEYNDKNNAGQFQTAITLNSAITRLLKALGWEFSEKDVEIDELIGNWVEVNIDDYEKKSGDDTYTASTIKDVGEYKGPAVTKFKGKKKEAPAETPKEEVVEGEPESPAVLEVKEKLANLESLHKEGLLSEDGLKQAREQLEAKLEELNKK